MIETLSTASTVCSYKKPLQKPKMKPIQMRKFQPKEPPEFDWSATEYMMESAHFKTFNRENCSPGKRIFIHAKVKWRSKPIKK